MNNKIRLVVISGIAALSVYANPNILLIMLDDIGAPSCYPYGCDTNLTPRIDSIAAAGMRFGNAHAYNACSATKVALLSGREAHRTGVWGPTNGDLFSTNEVAIGNIAQNQGYATGIFAKWNAGSGEDYGMTQPELIEHFGFDTSLCFEGPTIQYLVDDDLPLTSTNYWPYLYKEAAKQFIIDHADEPFMCLYTTGLPHFPYTVGTPEHPDASGYTRTENWWHKMECLDDYVGELLDTLESEGIASNTVIILTGDNGTPYFIESSFNGTVILGGKLTEDQKGTWVPLYVRHDGEIEAGSYYDGISQVTDLTATIADLIGTRLPADRIIDGISFKDQLYGKEIEHRKMAFIGRSPPYFIAFNKNYRYNGVRHEGFPFYGVLYSVTNKPYGDVLVNSPEHDGYNYHHLTPAELESIIYFEGFCEQKTNTNVYAGASIGDDVWHDQNGNGLQDGSEVGISNVTVQLYDAWRNEVASTVTDANGEYAFTNLLSGTYFVEAETPVGLSNSVDPDAGTPDGEASVTLGAAEDNTSTDFGYIGTGSIGNTIYLDTNTSGSPDTGEGIESVIVFIDTNGNGLRDDGEPSATTDENGVYLITDLPAGIYDVVVDAATLPADVRNTVDPDATLDNTTRVTLAAGQYYPEADWGYNSSGLIIGTIYNDLATNSILDGLDSGLANITAALFESDGTTPVLVDGNAYITTTDLKGFYEFTEVLGGNYVIKVAPLGTTLPSGSTNYEDPDGTTPPSDSNSQAAITLPSGGSLIDQNFGYDVPELLTESASPLGLVDPDDELTYTLKPFYGGSDLLVDATVSDVTPAGTVYAGNDNPAATSEPAEGSLGTITWNLGSNTAGSNGTQAAKAGGIDLDSFSAPTLSDNLDSSRGGDNGDKLPNIFVDDSGTAHTVFNQGEARTYYTQSANDGTTWSNAVQLPQFNSEDKDRNADVAVDSSGTIHVVVDNENTNVFYVNSTDGGATWNTPLEIDAAAGDSADMLPRIVVDDSDNVHVVFNDNGANTYYTTRASGGSTWTTPAALPQVNSENKDKNADLVVDSAGVIHVLIDNENKNVFYVNSSNGSIWSTPAEIDTAAGDSADMLPVITLDPSTDDLHVVFSHDGANTYYLNSMDGGSNWSTPLDITSTVAETKDISADVAVDACGTIHVVMNNEGKNVYYRYSPDGGTSWVPSLTVAGKEVDSGVGDSADLQPVVGVSGTTVFVLFSSEGKHVLHNEADIIPCKIATSTSVSAGSTLVSNGAPINITITVTAAEAVSNISPTVPTLVNQLGGASVTSITGTDIGPKSISAGGGSVSFTYTATAVAGTTLPSSVAFLGTASGTDSRGNTAEFPSALANSVLISPDLAFDVTVTDPSTVSEVINTAVLTDSSILINGVPSNPVENPVDVDLDYGDLPDSGVGTGTGNYQTLLADDGPRHIMSGTFLGTTPTDAEADGQQSALADGDDNDGNDDEDSVVIGPLVAGHVGTVTVTASGTGVLNVWIDWNNDGEFQRGEQILSDEPLVSGSNVLNVNVPPGANLGQAAVRFRVTGTTGQGGDSPTGLALTGEVEDYFAPVTETGTLIGHVYYDEDGSGLQNGSEPNLGNIPIDIVTSLGITVTVFTETDGTWTAPNLPPGSATVDVRTSNPNFSAVVPDTPSVTEGSDPASFLVPSDGSTNDTLNVGFYTQAEVIGHIYHDLNGNGTQDGGEPNLDGVDVVVTDSENNSQTVITDGSGNWTALVPPGSAIADVNEAMLPAGVIQSQGDDPTAVTAVAGDITDAGINGYKPTYEIAGRVIEDANGNGVDDTESGINGVTVELFADDGFGNPTGVALASQVTAGDGDYSFAGLVQGDYVVVETDPAGYTSTGDEDGDTSNDLNAIAIELINADSLDNDFLDTLSGTVGGHLYIDANGNGTQDAGEPDLANVTIQVIDATGTTNSIETDAEGDWEIQIVPGETLIDVDETDPDYPAGYVQTEGADPTTVTAVSEEIVPAGNDGYTVRSAIGNRVWLDEDGDGVQDAGESGVANQTVTLTGIDALGNAVNRTTVTDSDGGYLFADLLNSDANGYTVTVTPAAGLNATFDEDSGISSPDGTTVVVLGVLAEHGTADFSYNWNPTTDVTGNMNTGMIGDRIWIDANGDGVQDPGEAGLGGVSVTLINLGLDGISGTVDDTTTNTTTAADGSCSFDGLAAGAYTVMASEPSGYIQTGDPDSATTSPILLGPGDVYVNADFGYLPDADVTASIGDQVWLDLDGNGTLNGSESGVSGVSVALISDTNGNGEWDAGEPIISTTVTDQYGNYLFTGVPVADGVGADDYLVWVNDSTSVLEGLNPTFDSDGTATADIAAVTDLTPAGDADQDFGYQPTDSTPGEVVGTGVIGDTIFLDRDVNNTPGAGEGLEGVTVELYDAAGATLLATTETDENGRYYFTGLVDATYAVKVDATTLPGDAGQLTNSYDPDGGTAHEAGSTISGGTTDLTRDFGYRDLATPNSIAGTIWNDSNADGTLDVAETDEYADVTIDLLDADGNVIASTVTDANGDYSFTGLPDGTYTVDVTDTDNVLGGSWHSLGTADTDGQSQSDPYTVALSGGQNGDADFGYYTDGFSIGDRIWDDLDLDAIQDVGELGLSNVVVTLSITNVDNSVTTVVTTTDTNGNYRFDNLLLDETLDGDVGTNPGAGEPTYAVTVATPAGFAPTLSNQGGDDSVDSGDGLAGESAVPVQGGLDDTIDFGFYEEAIVSGHLYIDTNGNGTQDSGEPHLANVDVIVTNVLGNVQTVTTDVDGNFSATVPAGNTITAIDTTDPDYPAGYTQTEGTDPTTTLTVAGTSTPSDNDGFFLPATITGSVSEDLNGDTAGDTVLVGVTLTLYTDIDADGVGDTLVTNTTTDANGSYSFTGLAPGDYVVVESDPAGFAAVSDADTTDDSDNVPNTNGNDNIIPVTLSAGEIDADNEFVDALIAITGTVLFDENGLDDSIVNGVGTNATTLHISLVGPVAHLVIASYPVNADGTYSFDVGDGVTSLTSYNLILTTSQETAGSTLTEAVLPQGWASTGEFVGAPGDDGVVDSILAVTTTLGSVAEANFGIDRICDITPVITVQPNVMIGPTAFEVWVECVELLQIDTSDTIILRVPKSTRWTMTSWDPNATSLPVTGFTVNNTQWTLTQNATAFIFTTDTVIQGGTQLNFGFSAAWDAAQTTGTAAYSVNIDSGSGGEVRTSNNSSAAAADYTYPNN